MTELEIEIKKMTDQSTGWGDRVPGFTQKIVEICNHYAEFFKLDPVAVFQALEKKRDYSYPNYYQDANFPKLDGVTVYENMEAMKEAINPSLGFRCPRCNGISKDPYTCDSGVEIDYGTKKKPKLGPCDWKSYGLFGTLGKGLRFTVREGFLEHPTVDSIFYPIALESKNENAVDN